MGDDYIEPELPDGEPPVVDLAPPSVKEVVALLEQLLSAARAGELVAISAATVHSDSSIGTSYAGDYQALLLSGLERCKHRIHRDMDAWEA